MSDSADFGFRSAQSREARREGNTLHVTLTYKFDVSRCTWADFLIGDDFAFEGDTPWQGCPNSPVTWGADEEEYFEALCEKHSGAKMCHFDSCVGVVEPGLVLVPVPGSEAESSYRVMNQICRECYETCLNEYPDNWKAE